MRRSRPRRGGARRDDPFRGFGAGLEGWLRFQRSFLQRVSTYAEEVGKLAVSGSVEPGEWIGDYANFVSGVIGDFGDSVLETGQRTTHRGDEWLPVYRVKLRSNEGATSCTLKIPPAAFDPSEAPDATITLMMDGLVPRGGGASLDRKHFAFRGATGAAGTPVRRSDPRAVLHVFGLRDVVVAGAIYSGVVWVEGTRLPIAVIEITVE